MKHYEKISPFHYLFRLVDSHWVCVNDSSVTQCLADFLWKYGFNIPCYITYCLAENDKYKLKFRQSGGLISVFIHDLQNE